MEIPNPEDEGNISTTNFVTLLHRNVKSYLLLSNETKIILEWIVFAIVCQMIDVLGIVTNIINIMCFVKQGFKDPVNVSLVALAISDLGCLTTLIWTNICMTPSFSALDLPFDAFEVQYITGSWPHATFTRITSWITALITLERCLCITMPLKVKKFITTKRVAVIVTCVYVILIASVIPEFIVNQLGMKFYAHKNKSVIGLIYTEDREAMEKISFPVNNTFVPASAFTTITVCSVILVIKLKQSAIWRKKTTSAQANKVSTRNLSVAKMVVMISILFIICFVPVCFIFIGMSVDPEFSIGGAYKSMIAVLVGVGFILESINSSVNIFIYYQMSSRYREVFRQIMGQMSG